MQPRLVRPLPLEDAQVIEEVVAGQTEAFSALVEKYQDRVFNTCWRICGQAEEARDLTQEAFLKAFQRLSSFRHDSGFYTWIFRIAVNLALSSRRKSAAHPTVSMDQLLETTGTQADALAARTRGIPEPDAATAADEAELQQRAIRALNALDDHHRATIVLRDIEGLDYDEIAEVLEIPKGTVKSRLHRARMALREAMLPL